MNILPIALTPKKTLLIGAGNAAALKAKSVFESDCELTIVSAEIKDEYFNDKAVIKRYFSLSLLSGFDIVINATGDESLSKLLWEKRKEFGFLLNCVDMPKYCDFYFTANFRNHDLCVSVSTGGASPAYAQTVRDLAADVIPLKNRDFYDELRKKRGLKKAAEKKDGKVFLIGCGTGKKENLTIKALNAIKLINVALIDALVGKEIISLLPKNCRQIDVSKQKGCHKFSQEEINKTALDYSKQGFNVGRLKGGDPAVFGRVFEEASFLNENGVQIEMINGVSSVFAGCLSSGITPTLRGFSAGVLIVSAHLRESKFNDDWIALLRDFSYTIAVLMAYSFADKIVKKAKELSVDLSLPAAFVSQIDTYKQKTIIGTLGELEDMAKLCEKPAILIIGKAVSEAVKMPFSGERIIIR